MKLHVNQDTSFDPRLFLVDQELDRGVSLMLEAARRMEQIFESCRKDAKLSKSELRVLLAIRYAPGQSVSQLRTSLAMTTPTFARLIGTLDRDNLIERAQAKTDKRRRQLELSQKGLERTEAIAVAMRDHMRLVYRSAGPDAVHGARRVLDAMK